MKLQILILLYIIQIVVGGEYNGDKNIKSAFHLGSVDGKDYFAFNSKMNWLEARDHCEIGGYELATIQSQRQSDFLRLSHNVTTFSGVYWIGARDAQLPRALSWDKGGSTLQKFTGLPYGNRVEEYQLCGTYSASSDAPAVLLYKCSNPDTFALCQA